MRKVIVFTNLTLDGVMQAPGLPDEDLRGGFQHGGWAACRVGPFHTVLISYAVGLLALVIVALARVGHAQVNALGARALIS